MHVYSPGGPGLPLSSAQSQGGLCGLKNAIMGVPVPVVSECMQHVCEHTKKREGRSKGSSLFPHLQWMAGLNCPILTHHIMTALVIPQSLCVHHHCLVVTFP
jgi:hypothetical protein